MQVRILTAADGSVFQSLRLQALQDCPSAFLSSFEEESKLDQYVVAERLSPAEDRAVFGAFEQGMLIGVVGLQREKHFKAAHKAVIWGMYVASEFRQQGVGRKLMEQALAHAANLPGLRQVNLGVNAENSAAIALYESVGFKSYGVERDCLLVDGVFHDEINMVCRLPQSNSSMC